MSRIAHAVQQIVPTGLALTYNAADLEMMAPNDGNVFLHFKNTNGATRDITVITPGTVYGLAVADLVVTIAITTGDRMIGPLPPAIFNQSDGSVHFNVSATAGVTVAVVRMA